MPFFDSSSINVNGSKWWGIATIATFVIGFALPAIFKPIVYTAPFFISEEVLLAATIASVEVGFKNTVETNDTWKTWVQVTSCFANALIPAIFISSTYTV